LRRGWAGSAAAAAALAIAGCGSATGAVHTGRAARTLQVPGRYRTIQAAVDAARPGDRVLIAPGTYREAVTVTPPHRAIVIAGQRRTTVILDGGRRLATGIDVTAPGVVVENITIRRYAVNGLVFSPPPGARGQLHGWRGSYVTAADNGLYGVYAFGADHGRFDHISASGQPDSGIYVGRCRPCDALVTASVAEHNQVGYEATNASGDLVVRSNIFNHNRVGAEINSLRKEAGFAQRGSTFEFNTVAANDDRHAPRGSDGFGAGIVINGGAGNVLRLNRVQNHPRYGIVVLDSPDSLAADNRIDSNRLSANGTDLALQTASGMSQGNCFVDNAAPSSRQPTSRPAALQARTGGHCGETVSLR
jgi:hypothetical protein